jgi:hypothetical protein
MNNTYTKKMVLLRTECVAMLIALAVGILVIQEDLVSVRELAITIWWSLFTFVFTEIFFTNWCVVKGVARVLAILLLLPFAGILTIGLGDIAYAYMSSDAANDAAIVTQKSIMQLPSLWGAVENGCKTGDWNQFNGVLDFKFTVTIAFVISAVIVLAVGFFKRSSESGSSPQRAS